MFSIRKMNIFDRIVRDETKAINSLGNPLAVARLRDLRFENMAQMNPQAFRHMQPRKAARTQLVNKVPMTRGERKRLHRARCKTKVTEDRAPEFMHSAARSRFEAN